tara:strand:- start:215 stop:340 length:126 start_codon:yes stop_codon:yes gene_type:complete
MVFGQHHVVSIHEWRDGALVIALTDLPVMMDVREGRISPVA